MNFEPYGHFLPFLKIFCFSNTRFDGHQVETIFGKQGRLPLGLADPHLYRDHSPAVSHESRYRLQVAALLRRNGDKEPRGRTFPEQNLTAKLEDHWYSISNA